MDQEFSKVGLYPHNALSYRKVRDAFNNGENVVGIVQATGTGKTYQALQLALDNKDKKITYLVPSNAILEHIESIIASNPNLDRERDFSNLEFRTYQSLVNMSKEEIKEMNVDLLILDEFHHIGAPVWGLRVNEIIETHNNLKIFGMTAYTVRDRGTIYERDMALPGGDELFSDKIVNRYDLIDAMIDGVLPRPIYRSAYIQLFGIQKELEDKVLSGDANSKEYQEYIKILKDVKRRIEQAPGTKEMVLKNIKKDGKYIYFCPVGSNLDAIMKEAKEWFSDFNQEDIVFYRSISDDGDIGKYNRNCFYHDKDLEGNSVNNKLRIIFVINQYNEGVHSLGIDGVILGRATESDIVYFEQIGRALSVRGDSIKRHLNYDKLSIEELKNIAKSKDINITDNMSREEIINKLVAPVIIDLTNNVEFIKELEDNLQDRIKEYQERIEPKSKRIIKLDDFLFDIDLENQELFDILNDLRDRLYSERWEYMYSKALEYYEENGNLEIPQRYVTSTGEKLGMWVIIQRRKYKKGKMGSDKIRKLKLLKMRFETNKYDIEWEEMYEFAREYYEKNGNLDLPTDYKVSNGKILNSWIYLQKKKYKTGDLDFEKLKRLELIGINLDIRDNELVWEKMYNKAKEYYEEYGDLEISSNYVTSTGENLGTWIVHQRKRFNKGKLPQNRIEKLELIGMRFENKRSNLSWEEMYEYAKVYYEKNGNLEVGSSFTTNNGYSLDKNGIIHLGTWIYNQRRTILPTSERGQLLLKIGMRFDSNKYDIEWNKMYNLAREYYEKNHNLEISSNYVTLTGENLGNWIVAQRTRFIEGKLSQDRIEKLKTIGMRFETNKRDIEWNKMYNLAQEYYKENGNLNVTSSFKTKSGVNLGRWISHHREWFKEGLLGQEKIDKLTSIGMIWISNRKGGKKLKNDLCINYGIDYSKYQKELDKLSYQELYSKLCLLKDNDIPYIVNGELNNIFYMSSINMKVEYGFSLEELCLQYYIPSIKNKER